MLQNPRETVAYDTMHGDDVVRGNARSVVVSSKNHKFSKAIHPAVMVHELVSFRACDKMLW